MKFTILTLFPDMFSGPFANSILKIAQEKNLVTIQIVNIRDFGIGKHQVVDDTPYGGGEGMVLRADVVAKAIETSLDKNIGRNKQRVILLSAGGQKLTQRIVEQLATYEHVLLICGHYEGIDARISEFIDEEISVGDFVVTGGEIPAMLITDATIRLIKDVLKDEVTREESHSLMENADYLVEYPHYTRPETFNGQRVPDVLLSGHHENIKKWRKEQSRIKTKLLKK